MPPKSRAKPGKQEMRRRKQARELANAPPRMGHESMLALQPGHTAVAALVGKGPDMTVVVERQYQIGRQRSPK